MLSISVIGPINGVYHLGYRSPDESKFYSINEFISQELADAAAWLMNKQRYILQKSEPKNGR